MDKNINNNGYDYVDLGLPSGTLWAIMNVGASKPSDFGLYFQWGDTQGYTKEQAEEDKKFNWSDYKWYESGNIDEDNIVLKKYTNEGATLDLEDDAAHVHMGGDWHIPTPEQYQELIDNTISKYKKTQNGVNGILFTSKKDKSKTMFIPAAGTVWDGMVSFIGDNGYIWSSMMSTDSINSGKYLYFNSKKVRLSSTYLSDGLPVRGVIDKNNDEPNDNKNNMNDNLNLVEILKDAPKGTKLWSPIFGECIFQYVYNDKGEDWNIPMIHTITTKDYCSEDSMINWADFLSNGKLERCYGDDGECLLFPSKDNRDWSTFKVPKKHKHFETFQKVLRIAGTDPNHKIWIADFYSHYNEANGKHYLTSDFIKGDDELIPYDGNEDKVGKIVEK